MTTCAICTHWAPWRPTRGVGSRYGTCGLVSGGPGDAAFVVERGEGWPARGWAELATAAGFGCVGWEGR